MNNKQKTETAVSTRTQNKKPRPKINLHNT